MKNLFITLALMVAAPLCAIWHKANELPKDFNKPYLLYTTRDEMVVGWIYSYDSSEILMYMLLGGADSGYATHYHELPLPPQKFEQERIK